MLQQVKSSCDAAPAALWRLTQPTCSDSVRMHSGQCHVPRGTAVRGGSRQYRWYTRGHDSQHSSRFVSLDLWPHAVERAHSSLTLRVSNHGAPESKSLTFEITLGLRASHMRAAHMG